MKTLSAHVQRAYEIDGLKNRISFSEPWRNLPEIPSSDEINPPDHLDLESLQEIGSDDFSDETPRDSLFLPHNRIDRAWDDKAEYIGTHYQLVREDGVAPLRSAVSVFKQNPDMQDSQDVCIYTNVRFYSTDMPSSNISRFISLATHCRPWVLRLVSNSPLSELVSAFVGSSLAD